MDTKLSLDLLDRPDDAVRSTHWKRFVGLEKGRFFSRALVNLVVMFACGVTLVCLLTMQFVLVLGCGEEGCPGGVLIPLLLVFLGLDAILGLAALRAFARAMILCTYATMSAFRDRRWWIALIAGSTGVLSAAVFLGAAGVIFVNFL